MHKNWKSLIKGVLKRKRAAVGGLWYNAAA